MSDLYDMMDRLVLMEKDVQTNTDAVPVAFYAQEATPYWTNQIMSFIVEEDSFDLQKITYSISMTLWLATTTEGFEQEAERKAQTILPTILTYFAQRRQLKRTSADSAVVGLYPMGAVITGGKVNYGDNNSGIGQGMFGITCDIDVPMYIQSSQVVF